MKSGIRWLLLGLFLLVMAIIQFIPGEDVPPTATSADPGAEGAKEPQ